MEISEKLDEDATVKKIALRIRENLHKNDIINIKLGDLKQDSEKKINPNNNGTACLGSEVYRDIVSINSNWNVYDNSYLIKSHRPTCGPILIKGRQIINGEVRRYVDPIVLKQSTFNGSAVRIINETITKINELVLKINLLENMLAEAKIEFSKEITGQMSPAGTEIRKELDEQILQAAKNVNRELTDQIANTRTQIRKELDEQILQTAKNVNRDFTDLIANTRTQIRKELDEQILQTAKNVNKDLTDRIESTRTQIKKELNEQILQTGKNINRDLTDRIESTRTEIKKELNEQILQTEENVPRDLTDQIANAKAEMRKEADGQIIRAIEKMNEDLQNKAWLAGILEKRIEKNYECVQIPAAEQIEGINHFLLEERFRGSREFVKGLQSIFVRYFEGCKTVLDIGCGRGEFLELLKDNDIGGHGIDIDTDMVDYCGSKGFDVEMGDALTYLEKIEDKSLDGIFLDEVVEHLEPDYLIKMLNICYEKMKYGYYIVIGTVNPLSFASLANFYIDLTHKKPIHPLTLEFLLGSAKFREIKTEFFAKVPDEARLQKIETSENTSDKEKNFICVYNRNIDMLNQAIYGPQGYVVIGKK